jgi:hypothetical protein
LRFLTLLWLFLYANLSLALGLGDAELKSNLGEIFLAKIEVTDVESPPESSCFSATDIGDSPAFRKASVNLKANKNGNYQLTITSNDVITEPIVNLRVSFHCEPNVNREYVLLLDPAPLPAIENASSSEKAPNIESSIDVTKKQNRKSHQASKRKTSAVIATEQADDAVPEQSALEKVAKKKKPKNISSVDEKLLEAYTGKQSAITSPQSSASPESKKNANSPAPHQSADKPYLVISAGNANVSEGTDKPGLSLRLATEIDVARPDEVAVAQSATDTMDEVTVMSNRLAHLEKQIASLQTRNAQLVTEAQKTKEKSESLDWLQFLKVVLGILVAFGLMELIRRKLSNRQTLANDTWFDNDEPAAYGKPSNLSANSANEFNSKNTNSPTFDEPNFIEPPTQNLNAANAQTMAIAEKEDNSSIMEDADVFIEHGRPVLAIQLLQNHLIDSPSESPATWLKLLNLLSKEGTETEYDSAVAECNKHFNIKAAKYGNRSASDETSIEDYPHIVSRLEGVWGSPYAIGFLNDLIFNKRSQPREGLDQGAFNDLFFLKNIAKNLEHANPTIFKVSPEPSANKTSTSKTSVAATNIENTKFNDALFTNIDSQAEASSEPKRKLNDIKLGTKSNFNSFDDETSYEVNILPNDEVLQELDAKAEHIEFAVPEKISTPEDDKLFRAEEIDFSLPAEKVEYATGAKVYDLIEEIVLGDSDKVANKNHDLEFSLDSPNDIAPKQDLAKNKIKSKVKPTTKNQSESNEIEWDLPSIEPESDK